MKRTFARLASQHHGSASSRRRGARGAVLAEFMIVMVPLMTMFFSFVQLSKLATARLIVKHGAIIGARAASVFSNAHNNLPEATGDGQAEITEGVRQAMGNWVEEGSISAVDVAVNDMSSRGDPYGWVVVTVKATYQCRVPLGFIACGGKTKTFVESYRMPHQGAIYQLGR
jgi:Flp pilus assembly protein TadG